MVLLLIFIAYIDFPTLRNNKLLNLILGDKILVVYYLTTSEMSIYICLIIYFYNLSINAKVYPQFVNTQILLGLNSYISIIFYYFK
jgi:hypothetical protein